MNTFLFGQVDIVFHIIYVVSSKKNNIHILSSLDTYLVKKKITHTCISLPVPPLSTTTKKRKEKQPATQKTKSKMFRTVDFHNCQSNIKS